MSLPLNCFLYNLYFCFADVKAISSNDVKAVSQPRLFSYFFSLVSFLNGACLFTTSVNESIKFCIFHAQMFHVIDSFILQTVLSRSIKNSSVSKLCISLICKICFSCVGTLLVLSINSKVGK